MQRRKNIVTIAGVLKGDSAANEKSRASQFHRLVRLFLILNLLTLGL